MSDSASVIAARCGPMRGASQISVMSALAIRPPFERTIEAACSTKYARGGAFPLRVRRREMRADIAGAAGGQQGVGQRVQPDIGIGMAGEALPMRDRDAAKRHVVARFEGMHVIAIAGADVRKCFQSGKPLIGHCEILRPGEFQIVRRAGHDPHRKTGPFGDRRIVGEVGQAS